MSYASLDLSLSQGVAHITLNQPSLGNPFNEVFCEEWLRLANELASLADVRAILLKANGKFFSVGGDIGMFSRNLDDLPQLIRKCSGPLHAGTARLLRLDAPIVAAVHAGVMGGALALVAGCDLVYAARGAIFGSAYASIGYSCDTGASTALAARMGLARARRFVLLAETLKAEAAQQAGLVDYVVDDAAVLAEAEAAALRLAQGPTKAYGEIRRLFKTAQAQGFEAQLEDEAQSLARLAGSADAREGITAFAEKRKPSFQGK